MPTTATTTPPLLVSTCRVDLKPPETAKSTCVYAVKLEARAVSSDAFDKEVGTRSTQALNVAASQRLMFHLMVFEGAMPFRGWRLASRALRTRSSMSHPCNMTNNVRARPSNLPVGYRYARVVPKLNTRLK